MSGPSEGVPASLHSPDRKTRSRLRHPALILLVLLILAAFLLPLINLGRYHRTIADSLSRSLGHTVSLGSVNLAIFPLPGLVIHDLIVEEDPTFGAEPLLRAPSVTVFLRLSSLWRQRLEISRINLDNASVNLVRDPAGRWNFSSLLLQASRTASAPTAQRHPSAAPRFPYIEFSGARINFKEGAEKKTFSFLNADASVWLADPNQWRIRFEAQPARTDLELELEGKGTGTMRLEGSLTRAAALDQLPLDLHAEWTGAQLGQVSRLILGSDSGWRGDLRAEADITGDMRNLVLRSRLSISDAHRIEFTPLDQFDIDARCQATWHRPRQSLDDLTCLLPTGDGHLLLTGSIPSLAHPQPRLSLEINHTPLSFPINLLGLLRRGLPASLNAQGTINGQLNWAPATTTTKNSSANSPAPPANTRNLLTGHAVADTVILRLADVDQPIIFPILRFATPSALAAPATSRASHARKKPVPPPANIILLEPAAFDAGAHTPMQLSGQFSRSGFSMHFTGEGAIARLQPIAGSIPQFHTLQALALKGTAQSDLTFSGPWITDTATLPASTTEETAIPTPLQSLVQGWTRLQHAELKPAWLPEPIEIETATAQFGTQSGNQSSGSGVTWANATVSVNGIPAKGSASYPTLCPGPAECPAQLNLDFPSLDAAALQSALLGAGRHGEFLQAILSQVESPAPPWPPINGTIHAATLTLGSLKLSNARAAISVHQNRLEILSLDAAALGGSAHATGSVQFASNGPQYAIDLTCTGIQLADAGSLFPEKGAPGQWGTGSLDGQAKLTLHGYSGLAATAAGTFRWIVNGNWGGTWTGTQPQAWIRNASLNVSPPASKSSRAQWVASGTIANQTLTLIKGPLQGTIAFDRKLDLDSIPASLPTPARARTRAAQPTLHITGTLAHPIAAISPSPSPAKTAALPRRIR